MIVLDASAALPLLLSSPAGSLDVATRALHAPHLLDAELLSALRRLVLTGVIPAGRAEQAIAGLRDLRVARYSHEPLMPRAWELREGISSYDALYVALAEALGCPLVTCDKRLARSRGHEARIELLS